MIIKGKFKLVSLNWSRKKHVTTINRCISTVMCFGSRPLTSCPHLRKVSNMSLNNSERLMNIK